MFSAFSNVKLALSSCVSPKIV